MSTTEQNKIDNTNREERYLLALVVDQKIAFSARLIQEILFFKQSQILHLPFYDRSFLGVIHHQNQIVPLISGHQIFLNQAEKNAQATLTAVRLNQLGGVFTGVGVVVDQMIENISAREIKKEKIFQITDIPQNIWLPQR